MSRLRVLATGPSSTVQDEGRIGLGSLGVGRSGACDRSAYRLANRLVGNSPGSATIEVTLGGLRVRAEDGDLVIATTGARCPGALPHNAPTLLVAGREAHLGVPATGLRTYLTVRGGLLAESVLGSRSTDLLSGLGPTLSVGDLIDVGSATATLPGVDLAAVADPPGGEVTVTVRPGPRHDRIGVRGWAGLLGQVWTVTGDSNRIGVRLGGGPLSFCDSREVRSEGLVRGAVQLPPSGLPVLMLADHPVTGGYPVVAHIDDADVDRCGQLSPGQSLRLRPG